MDWSVSYAPTRATARSRSPRDAASLRIPVGFEILLHGGSTVRQDTKTQKNAEGRHKQIQQKKSTTSRLSRWWIGSKALIYLKDLPRTVARARSNLSVAHRGRLLCLLNYAVCCSGWVSRTSETRNCTTKNVLIVARRIIKRPTDRPSWSRVRGGVGQSIRMNLELEHISAIGREWRRRVRAHTRTSSSAPQNRLKAAWNITARGVWAGVFARATFSWCESVWIALCQGGWFNAFGLRNPFPLFDLFSTVGHPVGPMSEWVGVAREKDRC